MKDQFADLDDHSTTVFLDEGSLNTIPSVCAVEVSDVISVQDAIEDLIHRLWLSPDFQDESTAKHFKAEGFHYSSNPVIARNKFIDFIPDLDFAWWCSSNLESPADPYETLPSQFQWLAERILQKSRKKNKVVKFVFEQNDQLKKEFSAIVVNAVRHTGYNPEMVSFRVGTKLDRALSIADYCISVASKAINIWRRSCCNKESIIAAHEYRTFKRFEKSCSVLHLWDLRQSLSSRQSGRLLHRSYFELSGDHYENCTRSTQNAS